MTALTRLTVVIILQHIHVSDHDLAHLKHTYIIYQLHLNKARGKETVMIVKTAITQGLCSAASIWNTLLQSAGTHDKTSCRPLSRGPGAPEWRIADEISQILSLPWGSLGSVGSCPCKPCLVCLAWSDFGLICLFLGPWSQFLYLNAVHLFLLPF